MTQLMITGKKALYGKIKISGAKNAVLPQMAACLLTDKTLTLNNVPRIDDVKHMKEQLEAYGVVVRWTDSSMELTAKTVRSTLPATNVAKKTRAAFLVLGPLLAREKSAGVYKPGGCKITNDSRRPVNFHVEKLVDMGAEIVSGDSELSDDISMTTSPQLQGTDIDFGQDISVGATETIMMAACLAQGKTTITGAAVEPEVIDLAEMLKKMGAVIEIEKQLNKITISGQASLLRGATHTVMPDRIEVGTYAIAAAITGGELTLEMEQSKIEEILLPFRQPFTDAGVKIEEARNGIKIKLKERGVINPVDIKAKPYPGFPTDLLPQWVTFMTQAVPRNDKDHSIIKDTIYDGRFNHVEDLTNMGAEIIKISDKKYKVCAAKKLVGTHVTGKDLRGAAALVLAGLAAEGSTVVKELKHVTRGYENMVEKLKKCGAKLEIIKETPKGFYGSS